MKNLVFSKDGEVVAVTQNSESVTITIENLDMEEVSTQEAEDIKESLGNTVS
jgi:hypothetical protein